MPRKGADDLTGDLMLAAYRRKLGHMPAEQISFLTDRALERCRWFPTIAECLQIAAEWERYDEHTSRQNMAVAAVWREKQARMEEALDAMRDGTITQPEIDALPLRWQSIGETRGYLRFTEDGYALRPSVPIEVRKVANHGDEE